MSGKEEFGHDQFFAKKEVLFRPLEVAFFYEDGLGKYYHGDENWLTGSKKIVCHSRSLRKGV